MTESANIYGQLLLSSFLIGIFLHIVFDFFELSKALIFHFKDDKSKFIPKCAYLSANKPRTPLTAKQTLRKSFSALYPRNNSPEETILTAVLDILFAIVASLSVILLIFAVNNGILRGFVIPICMLGAAAYHFTLSKPLAATIHVVLKFILKAVIKLITVIMRPIIAISSPLKRLAGSIRSHISGRIIKKTTKRENKSKKRNNKAI